MVLFFSSFLFISLDWFSYPLAIECIHFFTGLWVGCMESGFTNMRIRACVPRELVLKGFVRDLAWLMFEFYFLVGLFLFLLRDWERIRFWDYSPVGQAWVFCSLCVL